MRAGVFLPPGDRPRMCGRAGQAGIVSCQCPAANFGLCSARVKEVCRQAARCDRVLTIAGPCKTLRAPRPTTSAGSSHFVGDR